MAKKKRAKKCNLSFLVCWLMLECCCMHHGERREIHSIVYDITATHSHSSHNCYSSLMSAAAVRRQRWQRWQTQLKFHIFSLLSLWLSLWLSRSWLDKIIMWFKLSPFVRTTKNKHRSSFCETFPFLVRINIVYGFFFSSLLMLLLPLVVSRASCRCD